MSCGRTVALALEATSRPTAPSWFTASIEFLVPGTGL